MSIQRFFKNQRLPFICLRSKKMYTFNFETNLISNQTIFYFLSVLKVVGPKAFVLLCFRFTLVQLEKFWVWQQNSGQNKKFLFCSLKFCYQMYCFNHSYFSKIKAIYILRQEGFSTVVKRCDMFSEGNAPFQSGRVADWRTVFLIWSSWVGYASPLLTINGCLAHFKYKKWS